MVQSMSSCGLASVCYRPPLPHLSLRDEGPLHTQAKSLDHEIVRARDSPKESVQGRLKPTFKIM
jgi:hypothetical protein